MFDQTQGDIKFQNSLQNLFNLLNNQLDTNQQTQAKPAFLPPTANQNLSYSLGKDIGDFNARLDRIDKKIEKLNVKIEKNNDTMLKLNDRLLILEKNENLKAKNKKESNYIKYSIISAIIGCH